MFPSITIHPSHWKTMRYPYLSRISVANHNHEVMHESNSESSRIRQLLRAFGRGYSIDAQALDPIYTCCPRPQLAPALALPHYNNDVHCCHGWLPGSNTSSVMITSKVLVDALRRSRSRNSWRPRHQTDEWTAQLRFWTNVILRRRGYSNQTRLFKLPTPKSGSVDWGARARRFALLRQPEAPQWHLRHSHFDLI